MKQDVPRLASAFATAALLAIPSVAAAQAVGAAQSFAIVGGTSVTAACGGSTSLISGDVGVAPGTSITGFPACATAVPPYGTHANDSAAMAAQASTQTLYNSLAAMGAGTAIVDELGGRILGPGTYSIGAANIAATTNLTLAGAGVYIFKVASSLTANVGSTVTLVGADPCQVFWQVTSAATLNGTNFAGNVVAQSAVTLGTSASLAGRALTTSLGAVTMAGSNVVGGCSTAAVPPTPAPIPSADLTITKSHTGNFVQGSNGTFTLRVSNTGGTASSGMYTVTDTLPTGLTFVSAEGSGFSCSNAGQVVTCTSSTPISSASSGATIALVVLPGVGAVPSVTNVASVSGGSDTVLSNNSTSDAVLVAALAQFVDLVIVKSHVGNFVQGTNATYTIAINNLGGAATSGTYTFVDTLPAGLAFVSAIGTNWGCSNTGQVVTCTNNATIAPGAAGNSLTLVVNPGAGAVPSVTNTATISGGGDSVLTNNTTVDVAVVTPLVPPVPTMSQWMMIVLMALLGLAGFAALSRRPAVAR